MIQLILTSPFQSRELEQALAYRQPDDVLVLMQDAVVAATAPLWSERLTGVPLYVMREDLQARGLQSRIGVDLEMADLVALIAEKGSPQTWAALGIQGLALYDFETQATAFLGEGGQSALRLKGDYDILLTNRLILQPTAEVNLYGRNDPQRGTGSGISDSEIGLRLRYEIVREFAPYIGVTWNHLYGKTADYAREEGDDSSEARLVLGVRMWF